MFTGSVSADILKACLAWAQRYLVAGGTARMYIWYIPDDSIETLKLEMLPAEWQNNPPPNNLKSIGDRFIESNKYAALKVPSVFITDEHNYLLNPAHPEFKKVRITSEKPIRIDNRLLSA